MTELIPIYFLYNDERLQEEITLLGNLLYRKERTEWYDKTSLADKKRYITRLLPIYEDIDDIQVWLIHLLAIFLNRVNDHGFSASTVKNLSQLSFPVSDNAELQLYRETLVKLLT